MATDINVDRTRKYAVNAGQCDKCKFFKTWAFKITNPKTGKQMPGHVTEEGYKIGDGSCPYWADTKARATFTQQPAAPTGDDKAAGGNVHSPDNVSLNTHHTHPHPSLSGQLARSPTPAASDIIALGRALFGAMSAYLNQLEKRVEALEAREKGGAP